MIKTYRVEILVNDIKHRVFYVQSTSPYQACRVVGDLTRTEFEKTKQYMSIDVTDVTQTEIIYPVEVIV